MEEQATTIMLRKPRKKRPPKPPGRTVVMLYPPGMVKSTAPAMAKATPPALSKSVLAKATPPAMSKSMLAKATPPAMPKSVVAKSTALAGLKPTRMENKPPGLLRTRMASSSPSVRKPPVPPPPPEARKPPLPPPIPSPGVSLDKKTRVSVPLRTLWMAAGALALIAALLVVPELIASGHPRPSAQVPAQVPALTIPKEERVASETLPKAEPKGLSAQDDKVDLVTAQEAAALLLSGKRMAALSHYRLLAEAPDASDAMAAMVIALEEELGQ